MIDEILGRTRRPRARTARARRARNRRSLLIAGVLAIVLLVGSYIWQRVNTQPPVVVSAVSDTSLGGDLLPLADPVKPLSGDHDMRLIPEEPPLPQEAPEGVAVAQVDIPQVRFDFGKISLDPPVSYIFAVQNTGSATLNLSNLVTSCGCTTAELSTSVIPPGKRADLKVVFDPDYHETVGPVTRLIWMASDDPTQPWLEIRVLADVDPSSS